MDNRRAAPRQRSFLQGRIYFNNRRSSVDCLIRDISETGAKLMFSHAVSTPEALELYIPNKDATFRARVQWRRGDEVGVAFLSEQDTSAATTAPMNVTERLQQVEEEVDRLRRVVEEMRAELQALRAGAR
ncbi:MAG TPA: PilZ domain-containing protein [Xanthobacteraceae bacterium]|jgi:hypothetical protein|nr:PilZ domain-containing protein [Xanthobacteraceae bacterium]